MCSWTTIFLHTSLMCFQGSWFWSRIGWDLQGFLYYKHKPCNVAQLHKWMLFYFYYTIGVGIPFKKPSYLGENTLISMWYEDATNPKNGLGIQSFSPWNTNMWLVLQFFDTCRVDFLIPLWHIHLYTSPALVETMHWPPLQQNVAQCVVGPPFACIHH